MPFFKKRGKCIDEQLYLAEDTKLKRSVALKFLQPELTHIPDEPTLKMKKNLEEKIGLFPLPG